MTPETCRAARALLNWPLATLAAKASVSVPTIRLFESGKRTPIPATLAAIRRALEDAGVEFLEDDGLRLRRPTMLPGGDEAAAAA